MRRENKQTSRVPQISVIIPTHKEWERLQLCVDALAKQELSMDKFEILVVDNEQVHCLPKNFRAPSNLTFLHEKKSGSYAARNMGIKHAKGNILAFTDADCIPDQKWLKNALLAFRDKNIERLAGNIQLFYQNPLKKTWAELYESVFAFNQKENVELRQLSVTANFFARKTLFNRVGEFDETQQSGEDWGWNRRATACGIPIVYEHSVRVQHPARYKMKQLKRKTKRVAGGVVLHPNRYQRLIKIPRLFLNNFLRPSKQVLQKDLSFPDKGKVIIIVFYLYLIYSIEYCKLLWTHQTKS